MTYPIHPKQIALLKKHERSLYRRKLAAAQELGLLAGFAGAERVFGGLHLPAWRLLGLAAKTQWRQWRETATARRRLASLADLEGRALADLGISRAQALYLASHPDAAANDPAAN